MSKKKDATLSSGIISGFMQAPFYPPSFIKVLIQIGHEPLPPFKSRSLFGREQYYYRNAFAYMKYVYSVEGLTGLYRGLGMKIVSHSVATIVYDKVSKMMEETEEENEASQTKKSDEDSLAVALKQTSKEITAKCWGIIISQPFHVMALRCMAQFVGGETQYSSWNIYQNTIEIYSNEGIWGFFSGLIPRLLFEVSSIAISNGIAYVIKTYIFDEKEINIITDLFASLIANSITYPLSVVSTVSSISGSALVAAKPPKMALYASWMDVFRHLYENNDLSRGSSQFFRLYKPRPNIPLSGFVLNNKAN
jgi:carrier protein